jgi:hypothetical protein
MSVSYWFCDSKTGSVATMGDLFSKFDADRAPLVTTPDQN